MSANVIEDDEDIVAYLERNFSLAPGDIEPVTESVRVALQRGYRRFGNEHVVSVFEDEDDIIYCLFGRITHNSDTIQNVHRLSGLTEDGYILDSREEATAYQSEVDGLDDFLVGSTLPGLTNLRLPLDEEVAPRIQFELRLNTEDGWRYSRPSVDELLDGWEQDGRLNPMVRGRVFTTQSHRFTRHTISLTPGDTIYYSLSKSAVSAMQQFEDERVTTSIDRLEWTGDEPEAVRHAPARVLKNQERYVSYEVSEIGDDSITFTNPGDYHPDMTMTLAEVVKNSFLGIMLPPLRHEQTTQARGTTLHGIGL